MKSGRYGHDVLHKEEFDASINTNDDQEKRTFCSSKCGEWKFGFCRLWCLFNFGQQLSRYWGDESKQLIGLQGAVAGILLAFKPASS